VVVQGKVSVHVLEPGVFVFKFLELTKLAYIHAAVLLLPLVDRRAGHFKPSADFIGGVPPSSFLTLFMISASL
jgi:hypothetical protein